MYLLGFATGAMLVLTAWLWCIAVGVLRESKKR